MCQFWHAFDNYDYDDLCAEISSLRKKEEESLEYFLIIFTQLCYIFPLDDRPSTHDFLSCLVFVSNETYELVDEEPKSCFNVYLHVDWGLHENVKNVNWDLHENVKNVNDLVGLGPYGYFFTMGDIDHIENSFSEEVYVSSHHSIHHFIPCDEKETSCVVNSSSNFLVADQEKVFPVDNGTLWVPPMVMSGSHYPISYFPSQGMEEETMRKYMNADHFINKENMDT